MRPVTFLRMRLCRGSCRQVTPWPSYLRSAATAMLHFDSPFTRQTSVWCLGVSLTSCLLRTIDSFRVLHSLLASFAYLYLRY